MARRKKPKESKRPSGSFSRRIEEFDLLKNIGLAHGEVFEEPEALELSSYQPIEYQALSAREQSKLQLDLEKLVEETLDSKDVVPKDLKFDDSSMPKAKNYYEWVTNEDFLGSDMPPYLEQALIGTRLFSEYCPDCSNMEWMADGGHSAQDGLTGFEENVQLLEYGVCPTCGARRSHLMKEGKLNFYNELAVNAGQRSGKSALVAMLSTYVLHLVLKSQKPTQLFRVKSNTVLHGTFVALTFAQAKDTLWDPFFQYLLEAPWFKAYHKLLRKYEIQYGQEILKLKDTFVYYRHRAVMFYPAGPDKRSLRGRCLTGSTLVNTNGGFLHFDEFIEKSGYQETDIKIDSHRGNRKVSHTYKDKSETYKVVTKNGFNVEGTPEHPMRIVTKDLKLKWRRLDELKEGDWIVSQTKDNSPMFGNTDLTKDEATLLGYYIANGYRREISSDDPKVVDRLYSVAKSISGFVPSLRKGEKGVRANTHSIKFNDQGKQTNGNLTEWLKEKGLTCSNSKDKYIPKSVRTAPKEVLHEFLESYFECDSGINGGSTKNSKSDAPIEIEVGSASEKLASQLHIILFHAYGILGRLEKIDIPANSDNRYSSSKPRAYYLITITGYDAHLFFQTFKRAKVQAYKDRSKFIEKGYGSDRRQVPYIRRFIKDLMDSSRTSKASRKFKCESGDISTEIPNVKIYKGVRPNNIDLSCPEFLVYGENWDQTFSCLEKYDSRKTNRLRRFLKRQCHFEQVVSVKKNGKKVSVYDVTVPKGHAFTANCLASHNTRILASIDEIAYFDNDKNTGKVKYDATEVYIALERSLRTTRNAENRMLAMEYDEAFTGYFLNISSPTSQRDKIMELVRLSQGSNKMLGVHKPTWDMNPEVTREALEDEFRKDYVTAMRDYGAQPPMSSNPFITSRTSIEDIVKKTGRNFATVKTGVYKQRDGTKYRYGMIDKIKPAEGEVSVLALDAGYSDNSFSACCGSLKRIEVNGDEVLCPVLDLAVEIFPLPNVPLHHSKIFSGIVEEIIEKRNVKILLADRWQSIKLLQDAEIQHDLDVSKQYSLKFSDFVNLRTAMMQGQFQIPRPHVISDIDKILELSTTEDYPKCFEHKPIEHLILQMLTVQQGTNTVIKGEGLTDDIWRAMALMYWGLNNHEYNSILKTRVSVAATTGGVLGVSKSGSANAGVNPIGSKTFGVIKSGASSGLGNLAIGGGRAAIGVRSK